MFESLALMSASSSSHRRLMSASSCGSIGLPSVPGSSSNRSSCRRVRSMKARPSPNVIEAAASSSLSTVAVNGASPSLGTNHSGNLSASQPESLPPAVLHDALFMSPTRRGNCSRKVAQRSQERCVTCALPVIAIAPETDRYRFVTTAFSSVGNNPLAGGVNCAATLHVIAAGKHAGRVRTQSQKGCAWCAPSAHRTASEVIARLVCSECTGKGRKRSQKRCAQYAPSTIQITPRSLRYGFVTVPCSCAAKRRASASELIALVAFRKCATLVHERSQIGCASCARLCIESNSPTGNVNCTIVASELIALVVSVECAGWTRNRSCKRCIWCAQSAIQTTTKTHHDSFVTAAASCTNLHAPCGDLSDAIAAPELRPICASSGSQLSARTRTACLPNLRLGEKYAARNCVLTFRNYFRLCLDSAMHTISGFTPPAGMN